MIFIIRQLSSLLLLGALVIDLAACSPAPTPMAALTSPSPAQPSSTSTAIPPSASPTLIPLPTGTSSPTFGPSPMPYPSSTPDSFDLRTHDSQGNRLQSPDGQWLWDYQDVEEGSPFSVQPIHIISADGRVEWIVKPHPEDVSEWDGGLISYEPLFWMPGSHPYLYLTPQLCCYDGPNLLHNQHGLVRFDLFTGSLSTLIPFTEDFYYFSFPPNGKFLLKQAYPSNTVDVIRMKDNETRAFRLMGKYDLILSGEWYQNGRTIALETCESRGEWPCYEKRILILDPETLSQTYLVKSIRSVCAVSDSDNDYYVDVEKVSETRLIVHCYGKDFNYEIKSDKITR